MRSLSVQHLVENDPHGPHVALCGIGAPVEDLRTHVHRRPHQRLVDLLQLSSFLIVLGKTKISYLVSLILYEDVGWLEVTVNNRVLVQIPVPVYQLFDDDKCL